MVIVSLRKSKAVWKLECFSLHPLLRSTILQRGSFPAFPLGHTLMLFHSIFGLIWVSVGKTLHKPTLLLVLWKLWCVTQQTSISSGHGWARGGRDTAGPLPWSLGVPPDLSESALSETSLLALSLSRKQAPTVPCHADTPKSNLQHKLIYASVVSSCAIY